MSSLESRFWFSLIFSVPLLFHMLVEGTFLNDPWFQLFYSLPAYLLGFVVFGKSAYQSVKNGTPNMDVLIITGVVSAFIYSLAGLTTSHAHAYMFFETGTTIISLVLLGNLIEKRSVKHTANELNAIQELRVQTARMIDVHDGHEHIQHIPFKDIRKGQRFLVNEGDKIPIDGVILKGEASVDESFVTGESLPVTYCAGDSVVGGTILKRGNITLEATVNNDQSFISNVIQLLKKAQGDKPAIQRLSDKAGAVFVQIVLVIAICTAALNYFNGVGMQESLMRAIAVLVISCPCAMGLATPTAVMVGIGKLARRGIMVSKAGALETLAKAKTLLLDKTGTLSDGKFSFEFVWIEELTTSEACNMIYHLEKYSAHPIAEAVLQQKHWDLHPVEFLDVKEEKGLGVIARTSGNTEWRLGSARMAGEQHRDSDIYLFRNGKALAGLRLKDELRPGAAETIAYFNRSQVKTVMLSGDSQEKCEQVAKETGISEIFARQTPADKLNQVSRFAAEGIVAMAGDGINDAPALNKASVAVSFGNASALAQQSAQLIILNKSLTSLAEAHGISKQVYQTIKQNLFWAFAYNIVAIPLAAFGYMHPMLAAASMAFSDVIVIGNAIRMRFTKVKL